MSDVKTMGPTPADLVKREWDRDYCREIVTLAAGEALEIGTVLGKVTADGTYKPSPATGETGEETACAVLMEPAAASEDDRKALALARGPVIVSDAALVYDASVNDAAKKAVKHAELAAFGIVVRHGV